jgi:menaquinone-dependent protoporphyrinogen oxidase
MHVLVTAASKHGGTAEIAEEIRAELVRNGLEATVEAPRDAIDVARYDSVVIGSAVYAGHWLAQARSFVDANRAELARKPVWLFSSGPLGDPLKPTEEPADAGPIADRVQARGHRVFGGRLDRSDLGFGERAIVRLVRAPDGDYRRWDDVRAWAKDIARDLAAA